MKVMKTLSRLSAMVLLVLVSVASAEDRLQVFAVNYPLAYFAQRIGAEHIDVHFPVPPDVDPAFWQPGADEIAAFQRADLILLNGADYAKWLKQASLPQRKLVNTSAAFQQDYISVEATLTHQHGPGGEHSHAGTAFTTWLDFTQAVKQAATIRAALEKKRPEHQPLFRQNFAVLEQELLALDQSMRAIVSTAPEKPFMASHPVYQYLARRYQIKLDSLMWEPDVIPEPGQWRALQQRLETNPVAWMIWEGQPNAESVKRLQAMGLNSLVFEPGANVPDDGDFISVMKNNIMELEQAYQP
ncbi:MAG: zinc ABC transporter substrate-binding protein [Thiotrichales bacterium]|nr:MAG: zinc ABC transporter substrate-binding protein [Thiotrichales bacterium]